MGQVASEQCCGNNSGDGETERTDAVPAVFPSTEIAKLTVAGEQGVSTIIPSAAKVSESKAEPKDVKTKAAKAPAAKESASGGGTEIAKLTVAGEQGVSTIMASAAKVSESKAKPKDVKTKAPAAKAPAAKAPAAKESAFGGGGKPSVAKAAKKKPAPVSTAKADPLESLKTLMDMGFDQTAATTALEAANGNVDQAIVMLSVAAMEKQVEIMERSSSLAPVTKPSQKRQKEALQEKVNMLTAMGFSEQQAKDALDASGGEVESAVESLTKRAA